MDTSKVIVELGSGTGAFRNRFLPEAWTIDLRVAGGIDLLADAMKLPFKPESIDELVANNPYGFGFKFLDDGVKFLEEVEAVLKPGGRLVIRAHSSNSYANERRMRQAALQMGLAVTVREINAQTDFPGHIFLKTYGAPTFPDLEFVISKEENPK